MLFSLPGVRRLRPLPAIGLLVACGFAHAQPPLSLEQAVQLATVQSRLVDATQAQVHAVREMAVAAGQRPDPVLKLGVANLPLDGPDRLSLTRDFMTMRSVGVMQELTRSEKLQARTERAEREAEAAETARAQTVANVQRDAALAWWDRSVQQTMKELLQAQVSEAELQVQSTETLFRSGKAMQADVFAARGQLEQWRDRVDQAQRQLAVATVQLTRWVGDAATAPMGPRPDLALPAWAVGGDMAQALKHHPAVAAMAQQEALAAADARVARANQQTDWSAEVMFSQRGPAYSNMLSFNLSVPLQWDAQNRQDRELSAKLARVEQARAQLADAQRAHEAEVRAMLEEWHSHTRRLQRYDVALLPLAAQRSAAATSAYRGGGAPLGAVLEARRAELETRMERLRIEMELARLWAQLTYVVPQDTGHRSAP